MRVQVCIPHYFKEHADPGENPNGYGSLRSGARLARSIALARCINGLLNHERRGEICQLNHFNKRIDLTNRNTDHLEINITVCTDNNNFLEDVINMFNTKVRHVKFDIKNSKLLPLATRDHLIHNSENADIMCYMEDDIIINDNLFFDKQNWFLNKTNHQLILMPHRFERIGKNNTDVLLVDGKLRPELVSIFQNPQENIGNGQFRGVQYVCFDIANNPHSGIFVINRSQAEFLQKQVLPTDGFIGPLETAATLTVLNYFNILKPNINYWDFLKVEHGHPSFLQYVNQLPHHAMSDERSD